MPVQLVIMSAWCGYCKAFYPIFLSAISEKKLDVEFAKVNVENDKSLAKKAGVHGLPTVGIYRNGDYIDNYKGERSYASFRRYLDKEYGKGYTFISEDTELSKHKEEYKSIIMWGASTSKEGFSTFETLAKEFQEAFVVFPESNYQKVTVPLVIVKDKNAKLIYSGPNDEEEMRKFIKKNKDPLSYELNEKTADLLLQENDDSPSFVFARNPDSPNPSIQETQLLKAAEILSSKIKFFLFTPNEENQNILNFFGMNNCSLPCIRIVRNHLDTDGVLKYAFKGEVTKDSVIQFYEDLNAKKLEPFFKSEPIPSEPFEGNVKKIVSDNYEAEVIHKDIDLFVMFHLPWCDHCKELMPIFHEIADELSSTNSLILAKIDSSLNEVKGVSVPTFPTLLYYKKGSKEKPILFTEEQRTKELLKNFIKGIQ